MRRLFPSAIVRDAEALYDQYHAVIYAYLVRLSGNGDVAADVLQETFYRAIRGAAGYRGDASPLSWLCTIARRCYADYWRRSGREGAARGVIPPELESLPDPGATPESALINAELKARITEIIATLSEQQRLALLLRDSDGLPYETIAEMLSLSLANVKVTIHRARQRFRALYAEQKE